MAADVEVTLALCLLLGGELALDLSVMVGAEPREHPIGHQLPHVERDGPRNGLIPFSGEGALFAEGVKLLGLLPERIQRRGARDPDYQQRRKSQCRSSSVNIKIDIEGSISKVRLTNPIQLSPS